MAGCENGHVLTAANEKQHRQTDHIAPGRLVKVAKLPRVGFVQRAIKSRDDENSGGHIVYAIMLAKIMLRLDIDHQMMKEKVARHKRTK